ncbi:hypothetical protein SK128_009897, partial [Halocaridina rubra]
MLVLDSTEATFWQHVACYIVAYAKCFCFNQFNRWHHLACDCVVCDMLPYNLTQVTRCSLLASVEHLPRQSRERFDVESNKMNWSQEKTVEFIEEYRKLAVLWDIRLTDYKNINAKLDALLGLAEKFNCDVPVVKKKIKNLRTAFRREHKSVTQRKCCSSPMKRSKWFAYDLLIFLLDVNNPRLGYSYDVEPQAEQPMRVE